MRSRTSDTAGGFWTPGRITAAVLAVLILVFILGNTRSTTIRLLIPEITAPLWIALLASAVLGLACGVFLTHRR